MKGRCTKMEIVYGVVTVSDKGQIAIPLYLRKDLGINQEDKLFVVKRKDWGAPQMICRICINKT